MKKPVSLTSYFALGDSLATANQHSSETIDYTQLGTGATYRSPCVVSIGNFDGCHLGHQTLLRSSIALGDQLNLPVAVLSFEPSPQIFFGRRLSGQELLLRHKRRRPF